MAKISAIAAGNAFLPGFIERFNARFAISPARPDDRHRPLNLAPDRLRDILCHRKQRHVGQQLALSYERKRIILVENETTAKLAGQYVDTYAFADGRLEVRWKGLSLPFRGQSVGCKIDNAKLELFRNAVVQRRALKRAVSDGFDPKRTLAAAAEVNRAFCVRCGEPGKARPTGRPGA